MLNLSNGVLQSLGETPLAAGHYSQLRLVLDPNAGNALANSVVPAGGAERTLETPSALQSGIKLVNEFDVAAGQRVDLVLDFDACKSVVTRGNGVYALKPVVKVIPTAVNGISGFVSPTLSNQHVMVTAQQNGAIVSASAPNPATGEFFLARLVPGNYDVAIGADASATAVLGSVPVASTTSTTVLSSSAAPILLTPSVSGAISGIVTMVPASLTETAFVSAKQSFADGPSVTVKYQGADVSAGSYNLGNLPLAAPQFVRYTGVLPLVFAAQTNTTPGTGKYQVAASATGYQAASVASVDILTTDQSNVSFTLVP